MSSEVKLEDLFRELSRSVDYKTKSMSKVLKSLKKSKKRKNGRVFYYLFDKIVTKRTYNRAILLAKVKEAKDYQILLHLNNFEILILRELMKNLELNHPSDVIKFTLQNYYKNIDENFHDIRKINAKISLSSEIQANNIILNEIKREVLGEKKG